MAQKAKRNYYQDIISKGLSNQRALFQLVDKLTTENHGFDDPSVGCSLTAEKFADFFVNKVTDITSSFSDSFCDLYDSHMVSCRFTKFQTIDLKDLESYYLNVKIGKFDPLPGSLFSKMSGDIAPSILDIINNSLTEGVFPTSLKQSIVTPLPKNAKGDKNSLRNYRPVSNLSFISKVLEKVVFAQLHGYVTTNKLLNKFQSAYRPSHSVETALLHVSSSILWHLENKRAVFLILLDLSAAFDTINRSLLLKILENNFGISGDALMWFKSYLKD